MSNRLLLVDLSGAFHRNFHAMAGETMDAIADKTLSGVRWLARDYEHVAICCDSGRSFRHDLAKQIREWDPEHKGYKGKRPPSDPVLQAQMARVERELYAEGFPIFRATHVEADDVIATICAWARANGYAVDVASEDKDLRSLATDEPPRVRIVRKGGEINGPEEVLARFGVLPHRLIELLAIAGDASDGVPGVAGLGMDRAAKLLTAFGSFPEAHALAVDEAADVLAEDALRKSQKAAGQKMDALLKRKFTPSTRDAIVNGKRSYEVSLSLVKLKTDVPVDCARAVAPRVIPTDVTKAADLAALLDEADEEAEADAAAYAASVSAEEAAAFIAAAEKTRDEEQQKAMDTSAIKDAEFTTETPADRPSDPAVVQPLAAATPQPAAAPQVSPAQTQVVTAPPQNANGAKPAQTTGLAVVGPERPFEKQLEPRTPKDGWWLAEQMFASKMFKDVTSVSAAYMKLAVGRSMGLTFYQSLQLHMFQGKIVKPALQIVAQVRLHPHCEYFHKTFGDATRAVWATKRKGNPRVAEWEFTLEEAVTAGLVKPDSNYHKWSKNMCSWRAATFLAREEWSEVVGDFLTPEEIADMGAIDTVGEAA